MSDNLLDEKILKIADMILKKYHLCDHCLGRTFAKVETGLTNKKRGEIIREHLKVYKKTDIKKCWLCNGLINEIIHFSNLIRDSLSHFEYDTFLIGSKVDEEIIDKELELIDFSGSQFSESIKTELNREIGKILEYKLKKKVNFEKPTIMAIIDTSFDVVRLQISSLFIYGKYRKFRRDIPQTKWFCKICHGKGCKVCNYLGKLYKTSIEEIIAKRFLEITGGDGEAFHGCGREDVDVRMLGNGRPFVLEIKNPKIRNLNLLKLQKEINSVNKNDLEIFHLRYSNKDEITRLKHSNFKKTYRIVLKCVSNINNEKLKKAALSLRGKKIGQFTPSRVAHRRAKMVREKHIYNCRIESTDGVKATLILEAESGTYIKELISGDGGRTKPNLSDIIGIPCQVTALDVIDIKGE